MMIQEEELLKAYMFIKDELSSVCKSRQEKKSRSLVKVISLYGVPMLKGTHNLKTVTLRKLKMGTLNKDGHVLLVIDIGKGACFTRHLFYASFKMQSYGKKF